MDIASLYTIPLLLTLGSSPSPHVTTTPRPPDRGGYLSAEDAVYLDYLVHEFLFDPKGATRVRVTVPDPQTDSDYRLNWSPGGEHTVDRDGWLVAGKWGAPDRVYFTDGESIVGPFKKIRSLDFEADCVRRSPARPSYRDENLERLLYNFNFTRSNETALVRSAWLHRRGYDALAAQELSMARAWDDDPLVDLRSRLATHAYDSMRKAVILHNDAEAIAHGERLFRLYADRIEEGFPQAAAMLSDLKRRQKAGTFGKVRENKLPNDFADWNAQRKLAYLVNSLDQVAPEPVRGTLGNEWSLERDRIYRGLVELGDVAVPAVLDAIERDTRLTRCTEWDIRPMNFRCGLRDNRAKTLISVSEVAERIVRGILRVRNYDLAATEEPDETGRDAVPRMRQYWATYGHLPFDDRMMLILRDSTVRPAARREAADALVFASQPHYSSSWTRPERPVPRQDGEQSPLVAKYKSPTVAEAILAARDEEHAQSMRPGFQDRQGGSDDQYLHSLVHLGDQRVGNELARRAHAAVSFEQRLLYAKAANYLGYPGPMLMLARDLQRGSIVLTEHDEGDNQSRRHVARALKAVVNTLIASKLREADEALFSLADTDHPLFLLSSQIVRDEDYRFLNTPTAEHPFFVAVLAKSLADLRVTGVHYYLRGDVVEVSGERERDRNRMTRPECVGVRWMEHSQERTADTIATLLTNVVCGLPAAHPLRHDQDQVLQRMKSILDQHRRGLRRMNEIEQQRFGMWQGITSFIPDIRPLARPATADDVKAGRAVFDLSGKGKSVELNRPGWLLLKTEAMKDRPSYGLVVQVECDVDGNVVYGVIFRHEIRKVHADEVVRIEPYEKE